MTDTNQEVRETWVTVPRVPTERMLKAADGWTDLIDGAGENSASDRRAEFAVAWEVMVEAALASAPPPAVPDAVGVREEPLDTRLDSEKAEEWPAAKKALWRVVTGEKLNDGHYINAWRLTDKLYAALSSIEPTPSPEPQASNAGAPVMWICEFFSEDGSLLERRITEDRERLPKFVPPGSTLKITPLFVTRSTPEPQTGERDKAIHDIAEAIGLGRNMCDDDGGGSTDLDVFRQAFFALDAVEQMLLAERTAREAAETRVREQQQAMEEDDGMVAEQVTRAEAAERCLAEVEERAKEDERDRLLNATDHVNTPPYRVALRLFLREHGAMEPADRAALRAKPEAQAIVGKEAGE